MQLNHSGVSQWTESYYVNYFTYIVLDTANTLPSNALHDFNLYLSRVSFQFSLPEHELSIQLSACSSFPTHCRPSIDGDGSSQRLWRFFIPLPQVAEQLPQFPQGDQPPSVAFSYLDKLLKPEMKSVFKCTNIFPILDLNALVSEDMHIGFDTSYQ